MVPTEKQQEELRDSLNRANDIAKDFFSRKTEMSVENIKLLDEINDRMVEETGFKMLYPKMTALLGFDFGILFHHQEYETVFGFKLDTYGSVLCIDPNQGDAVVLLQDKSIAKLLPDLVGLSKLIVILQSISDQIRSSMAKDFMVELLSRIIGDE